MSETHYTNQEGHQTLRDIEDGTKIKYEYTRGEHAGEIAEAEIRGGHIIYNDEKYSPSGAARAAMRDIRGNDYEQNGWKWWKYYDEETEEWRKLENLR